VVGVFFPVWFIMNDLLGCKSYDFCGLRECFMFGHLPSLMLIR
jgi:hypothetical protein